MDIALVLASANAAFDQVKRVSQITDEATAVMGSITGFAAQMGELKRALLFNDLQELHGKTKDDKKPQQTATEQAMQVYTAKVRLRQMEQELYHMFLYGDLNHLGQDGYKEFCRIRQDIEDRAKKSAEQDQAWALNEEADEEFLRQFKIVVTGAFGSIVAVVGLAQQIKDLFS